MDSMIVFVPLDGSAASEQALPTARTIAAALRARIELVYVVEEHAFPDNTHGLLIPDQLAAERYLRSISTTWRDEGVTTRVLRGNPAHELLELTHATDNALVVMATHGRGSVGRLVFGSVTDKVVRGASVPVVAVRVVADEDDEETNSLSTIVVALDGSTLAESALPLATAVARGVGATLHLVRVIEPFWRSTYATIAPEAVYLGEAQVAGLEERAESDARAYLDQLAGALRAGDQRVVWETRFGRPADELARAVETSDAGLVVMATHGRGGLSRWALGSVASELLQRGVAPVMVVRPLAAEHSAEPEAQTRLSIVRAAGNVRSLKSETANVNLTTIREPCAPRMARVPREAE